MDKPTLPKGTRDFGPAVMAKRQFILDNIKKVFQKFGFQPLETPAMENLSTLIGKYGDEGDQLLFRIQDSEDFLDEEHSFLISSSGSELLEFFSKIDYFIGANKIRSFDRIDELSKLITQHINAVKFNNADFENQLKLSDLYSKYSDWIAEAIIDWYTRPIRGDVNDTRNHAIEWFKNRNGAASTLISRILRDKVAKKGLRYDLTVPFARFVVMNRHEIAFPFKRYQVQPVWRADKPQKGRYREFYQCDADIVGSDSLINEAELLCIYREAFYRLQLPHVVVKINNRKVLQGIAEYCGAGDKLEDITKAIDKFDKIGRIGVENELTERGLNNNQVQEIMYLVAFKSNIYELNLASTTPLDQFEADFLSKNIEVGVKGIQELKQVINYHASLASDEWSNSRIEIDFTLARGLNYYTGIIVEVATNSVKIGSIGGGGRYDNLTQAFGSKEKLSGVGISFGVDRIYDVLEELNLFPKEAQASSKILICPLDTNSIELGLKALAVLRRAEISSEIFPDPPKEKKPQEKPSLYADKKLIPFMLLVNSDGMLTLKDLKNKGQENLTIEQIIQKLKT